MNTAETIYRLHEDLIDKDQKFDDLEMRATKVMDEIQRLISANEDMEAVRDVWLKNPSWGNKRDLDMAQGTVNGIVAVVGVVARHHMGEFI